METTQKKRIGQRVDEKIDNKTIIKQIHATGNPKTFL